MIWIWLGLASALVGLARTGARARARAGARARARARAMARKRRRLRENILMIIQESRIILRTILIKSMLTRRFANCLNVFRDGFCLSFR